MARYKASYDFPHDPDCIYGILSDVERMSEFMPLCKRSQILSRRSTGDAEVVEANFLLRYRQIGFERDLDLVLTLRPAERQVEVATTDPTLAAGSARCIVTGTGGIGSRVFFESDYRIGNFFVRTLFGRKLLRLVTGRIMERVQQRAEALARQ